MARSCNFVGVVWKEDQTKRFDAGDISSNFNDERRSDNSIEGIKG